MKIKLLFLLALVFQISIAQNNEYHYKRALGTPTESWHQLILPDSIFSKIKSNASDIVIYGITSKNDTIEAPYVLKSIKDKWVQKEISYQLLNTSSNETGYFYTLNITNNEVINQINLNLTNDNFDGLARLEGSNNQNEWFTLLENARLVTINNDETSFQFGKLTFPDAQYKYYRIHIRSNTKPELTSVSISKTTIENGTIKTFQSKITKSFIDKATKQSIIDFEMPLPVPVNSLKINISDTFDYYRDFTLQELVDSTKIDNKWICHYENMSIGNLNSALKNNFDFDERIGNKFRLIIDNQDNQPLNINNITLTGNPYKMWIRFTEKADYYLFYGNDNALQPKYDLENFIEQIPQNPTELSLGKEIEVLKTAQQTHKSWFENPLWLWLIIGSVMVLLTWFTIKMIKGKE